MNDSMCFQTSTDNKECVLRIIHWETAVASLLIVTFLKVIQIRYKTAMVGKRLRQVKAEFTVLSVQQGDELRD